jgi:hypothetical protein
MEVEQKLHAFFLTLALLEGGEWSDSRSSRFPMPIS